jgi:putative transposase
MPRRPRVAPGGFVYHCLNRAVARLALFEKREDYAAFERVLEEAVQQHPMRILAYCIMPNHWHLVLWPRRDGELTDFVRWLTHTQPVETDEHFYSLVRYVERNALRGGLVSRAEDWRWSSLWRRQSGDNRAKALLHAWPLPEPSRWLATVNRAQTESELAALRNSVNRSAPFGTPEWQSRTAKKLSLEWTLRARGRPRKK